MEYLLCAVTIILIWLPPATLHGWGKNRSAILGWLVFGTANGVMAGVFAISRSRIPDSLLFAALSVMLQGLAWLVLAKLPAAAGSPRAVDVGGEAS